MPVNFTESLRLLFVEAYNRRHLVIGAFIVIALLTMIIGATYPKKYTSSSTIYLEDRSVIGPLMQGAAVQSPMADRAMIAREVIYGRKILDRVVREGGFVDDGKHLRPSVVDGIIGGIRTRTVVTNVGDNLVRIDYTDNDAERAQRVAQMMAELFVAESLSAKARESETAFVFIERQVKEYQKKLQALEADIKEYRRANGDVRTGVEVDSSRRIAEMEDTLAQLGQDLREAEVRRESIRHQLSGEADGASGSRSAQYRQRIGELQAQLDTLLLTYHETYPDVIRIKDQIKELEHSAAQAERQGDKQPRARDPLIGTPLFMELKAALYEANTSVQAISSRIEETRRLLAAEEQRARRSQSISEELSERARDHEVTVQIYQDLLKRREAARVSMEMDRSQKGITIRVEEPAFLPHTADSPPLPWFAAGGILLGIAIPLGVVFAIQQTDQRVRHSSVLEDNLGIAALGVVPHLHTPREAAREARSLVSLGVALIGTLAAMGIIGMMRMTGAI